MVSEDVDVGETATLDEAVELPAPAAGEDISMATLVVTAEPVAIVGERVLVVIYTSHSSSSPPSSTAALDDATGLMARVEDGALVVMYTSHSSSSPTAELGVADTLDVTTALETGLETIPDALGATGLVLTLTLLLGA